MNDIAPPRSRFVTVLATVFIVLSGGMTLFGVVQALIMNLMFPAVLDAPATTPGIPPYFDFLAQHVRAFYLAFLLLAALLLFSSIGLLKRMRWARIAFVALMALGIAWNAVGMVVQHLLMQSMLATVPQFERGVPEFGMMLKVAQVFSLFVAVGTGALYAWIIYKLLRPEIAAEFA